MLTSLLTAEIILGLINFASWFYLFVHLCIHVLVYKRKADAYFKKTSQ